MEPALSLDLGWRRWSLRVFPGRSLRVRVDCAFTYHEITRRHTPPGGSITQTQHRIHAHFMWFLVNHANGCDSQDGGSWKILHPSHRKKSDWVNIPKLYLARVWFSWDSHCPPRIPQMINLVFSQPSPHPYSVPDMITWHLKRIRSAVPVHWKAMIQIMYTILTRNCDMNRINYRLESVEPICSHHWVEWVGGRCMVQMGPARAGIMCCVAASGSRMPHLHCSQRTPTPRAPSGLWIRWNSPYQIYKLPGSSLYNVINFSYCIKWFGCQPVRLIC